MKTRMEETVQGILLCSEYEQMGWTSIQEVTSAARWKTWYAYCSLLVEKSHLVWDGEQLSLRDIQAAINRIYKGDLKKSGLFSHLPGPFKEDGRNTFSSLLFEVTHAEWPDALPHQLEIVIVKSFFGKCGLVPTLAYYDAASNIFEGVPIVSVPVLQRIFASDHFGPTGKRLNSLLSASSKNEPKSNQVLHIGRKSASAS